MFHNPAVNIRTQDVSRLVRFYEGIGFVEVFRTPEVGEPVHVELTLDGRTIGIASVDALLADHGLHSRLRGESIEIAIHADDVDTAYALLLEAGATALSEPHDYVDELRLAWVADPDGNPIRLIGRNTGDGRGGDGR